MREVRLNTKLIGSLSSVLRIPSTELIEMTGIPCTTWYAMMGKIEGITIQQLLAIANSTHVPVRRFFSFDKVDVVGHREDYVTDPYIPCRYEGHQLEQLVSTNPDVTWTKAAKAAGMNYSRLKESVLAVRRTPVIRFLTVCKSFSVDPFSVLVDPNPEIRKGRKVTPPSDAELAALRNEVSTLHSNVKSLKSAVDELKEKYEAILSEHERLKKYVKTGIKNAICTDGIDVAAEP